MFLPKILSTSAPIYVNTFKSVSGQFWECKAFWYSLLDQLRTLNDEPLQMDLTLHIFERTLWCMKTPVLDLESYFLLIRNHYIARSNTCVWKDLTNCRVLWYTSEVPMCKACVKWHDIYTCKLPSYRI